MAETTEADILRAVQKLDDKLSRALKDQTDTLTKRIQELADHHTDALIEQEKRNATFATITRMEEIGKHYHTVGGVVQEVTLRQSVLMERITKLEAKGGVAWNRWIAVAAVLSGPAVYIASRLIG